jgi:transcriptional regulator with GAF, ATPase, and Fis domain
VCGDSFPELPRRRRPATEDGVDDEPLRFGSLVARSAIMRDVFAALERLAHSDVTTLLSGETGTGKEDAAASIHAASRRAGGPFVIVDCAAIPAALLESELFGHERAAFTGAAQRRIGAFEQADGGTVFLDEIGELPIDLQPKLLRVLERKQIRRVGSNDHHVVDVRVIAATHRDLRALVDAGRFRDDLYYRLAVVWVTLPPLRDRPDDIVMLAQHLLAQLGATPETAPQLHTAEFFAALTRRAFPGNVRELRNHLERHLVMGGDAGAGTTPAAHTPPGPAAPAFRPGASYAEERARVLAAFEAEYVRWVVATHGGNIAAAARAAGMDRAYLWRMAKRRG